MTLTLKTANVDLHSGLFGWIAPNSAYEATKLLSKLYNEKNEIFVPGYYDTVGVITDEMKQNNKTVPFHEENVKAMTGIKKILPPEWYDPVTANGLLPTIQISGIQSGYTWTGYRNAIPAKTMIKLNFRFAPGQHPENMVELFSQWVAKELPDYVEYTIDISDPYPAILIDLSHVEIGRAAQILGELYETETVYRYVWAAIPVTGMFQDVLGASVIIADLANEDCNMHGVGENFRLSCVEKGLEFSRQFFSN